MKEISITGVSAFKLEGKGVQSFPEKKPIPTKPKAPKETKKTAPVVQPTNLSIMVLELLSIGKQNLRKEWWWKT